MNGRITLAILAAAAGTAPAEALAAKQGQVGSSSQASISIKVSVAPRIQLRKVAMTESGGGAILCLISTISPSSGTTVAVPGQDDPRVAMVSGSSAQCAEGQSNQASPAKPLRPEAGSEGMVQSDRGAVLLLVRPE